MLNNVKDAANPVSRSLINLNQATITKRPLSDRSIQHIGQANISRKIG
jgi:hypothetical protein